MLTASDNAASLCRALQEEEKNKMKFLDSAGFKKTKVNSRTPGRGVNREQYGWGQTTPKEMVMLLEKIYIGKC